MRTHYTSEASVTQARRHVCVCVECQHNTTQSCLPVSVIIMFECFPGVLSHYQHFVLTFTPAGRNTCEL